MASKTKKQKEFDYYKKMQEENMRKKTGKPYGNLVPSGDGGFSFKDRSYADPLAEQTTSNIFYGKKRPPTKSYENAPPDDPLSLEQEHLNEQNRRIEERDQQSTEVSGDVSPRESMFSEEKVGQSDVPFLDEERQIVEENARRDPQDPSAQLITATALPKLGKSTSSEKSISLEGSGEKIAAAPSAALPQAPPPEKTYTNPYDPKAINKRASDALAQIKDPKDPELKKYEKPGKDPSDELSKIYKEGDKRRRDRLNEIRKRNVELLDEREKINKRIKDIIANQTGMMEKEREELEKKIPEISKKIEELEAKRDELLEKVSTPVSRRNLLVGSNAYHTVANVTIGGLLQFVGNLANARAGTEFKTFFEMLEEKMDKEYNEKLNQKNLDMKIYQNVSELYKDEKAGLRQYRKDSFDLLLRMTDLEKVGIEEEQSLIAFKQGLEDRVRALEEEDDQKLAEQAVKEYEIKEAARKERNLITEKENKQALLKHKRQLEENKSRREAIKELRKESLEKYEKEEDRNFEREKWDYEKSEDAKDRLDAEKDRKAKAEERAHERKKWQMGYDQKGEAFDETKRKNRAGEKLGRQKLSHDILKEANKQASGGDGKGDKTTVRNYTFKRGPNKGKVTRIQLSSGATGKVHERLDSIVQTSRELSKIQSASKVYADKLLSGDIKGAKTYYKTVMAPIETAIKGGVRIQITGGGNISGPEQAMLTNFATGKASWIDVVNMIDGTSKKQAIAKLKKQGKENYKS